MLEIFTNIDVWIVILYLLATLWIGFKYGKNVKNITDYAVADRNYPDIVIVATIFATIKSLNIICMALK